MRQALLAGLSGLAATALDVAVLASLMERGCPVALAAWLGAAAGAAASFLLSRRLAFRDTSPLGWPQIARFATVAASSAAVMALAMHVTSTIFGVPYLLAKAGCAVAVFALWTLPAQRRFVFVAPTSGAPVEPVSARRSSPLAARLAHRLVGRAEPRPSASASSLSAV